MNRWMIRVLALLGLAAWPVMALATPSYTAVILPSNGAARTYATGIADNRQIVGYSIGASDDALLWTSPYSAPIDLTPAGYSIAGAGCTIGAHQGGYATIGGEDHAILWSGSATNYVDLNPPGFTSSDISGIGGNQEVGNGANQETNILGDALLWTGTNSNAVDLNPKGFNYSVARATNGMYQIGSGNFTSRGPSGPNSTNHALLWSGTPESGEDLNPAGYSYSEAWGISGDLVVGWGSSGIGRQDALLWNISDAIFTDLGPGVGYAVAGNYEVGYRGNDAMLWSGRATNAVDLQKFLPPSYAYSVAYGVDKNGNVVGAAGSYGQWQAVVWMVPEPAMVSCALLVLIVVPARRRRTV